MPPAKPLPTADQESREFWAGVKARQLKLQRCLGCRRFRFYPRAVCPHCLSGQAEWLAASGKGTVYSFTVCHRPAGEAFAAEVPYIVALIDLAEGVRVMSNLVRCQPAEARVGMPVEAVFEDLSDEIALYKFRPVD
ncbi:MAG: Zn-ribbon domain-containing OB-fold protein [Candidatus Rokubacteria bacterium]|nr:Zn-ribbon domain-containing OB-fold protein [Candidatus Rokubacteria bacterium]